MTPCNSLVALLGNGGIIIIACDHYLHTPMYFLLNLSIINLSSISTTIPKYMASSLWDTMAISHTGCAVQLFLFTFLVGAEYFLLIIMAYDRYVAICKPLHYGAFLGSRACVHMAAASWGNTFLNSLLHTANTFSLPLCKGNVLKQFFCEIPQILKLSWSDAYPREVGLLVVSFLVQFVCFVFIMLSYVQIFRAVLRMPSQQGQHKAFSMCLPHLVVVSLFIFTSTFAYLKPPSISSPSLDMVVAALRMFMCEFCCMSISLLSSSQCLHWGNGLTSLLVQTLADSGRSRSRDVCETPPGIQKGLGSLQDMVEAV